MLEGNISLGNMSMSYQTNPIFIENIGICYYGIIGQESSTNID